ncbi:tol-pal system protein YbgF [Desulfovibrio sp. ZJ200]|uniref:tol-pal system protein YbgF n=1 Tax=Desulfovibrio sp. ZJ200 TaxID=2709792 RepID=UPI0013ECD33F|nr:tol-pal system protein YbgF [Desulfovibrio sp. ZJ200]
MKKLLMIPAACLLLAGGCASTAQMRKLEESNRTNQATLRETDHRLQKLEQSVAALDSQVAMLNNRAYEVRTRGGRKTGMTVVPIIQAQTARAAAYSPPLSPASVPAGMPTSRNMPARALQADQSAQKGHNSQSAAASTRDAGPSSPSDRVINPAAPPTPLPGKTDGARAKVGNSPDASRKSGVAGPAGRVGSPDRVAGPTGQLAASEPAPGSLALPPVENPALATSQKDAAPAANAAGGKGVSAPPAAGTPLAAQSGTDGNAAVQVPALPPSALSLPPEHPGLPPLGAAAAETSAPPASRESAVAPQASPPQTVAAPKAGKGEDRAYKAALQVALSGRSAEGIARFREFLQHYPQGRYAANAEYWTGECLYAQGKLQEALAQFEKVNAAYPRHHKNADALLKAGMCLSRLGDKQGAASKYKTLLADFPNSEAARLARSRGFAR